jgi:putative phosphoesterase
MRIGIISDTHDRVERTARAVKLLAAQGAQTLIHCGDLTGPEIVAVCAPLPCYYVFGNNDFSEDLLERAIASSGGVCLGQGAIVELANRRIAVAHGHEATRIRRLLGENPEFLLFGHSHHPTDLKRGPTRWINPGALHRAANWTVASLDLGTDQLHWITIA